MDKLPGGTQAPAFKTFPAFTKLTLANRAAYEALVAPYPPISDISFPSLMMWWNRLDSLAVALLNSNVVISYWLPGDEELSGLSIVGTERIDESICAIFDYQKEKGDRPRLVHVPEFVMTHMRHAELFSFAGERSTDEYVLPVAKFYPLNHMLSYRRHRVRKFLSHVDEDTLHVRSIDLTREENQRLLLDSTMRWPQKGTINALTQIAIEAMTAAITQPEELGTENVCLFAGNTLHAYILYHLPADKRYAIFSHAKLSYELPYLFDYMVYAFAKWFADQDVTYINLDVDYNVPMLRMIKLALGPENFFRKYTVTPLCGQGYDSHLSEMGML